MVLESAQLLSTAHRVLDEFVPEHFYKTTHINHPCSKWTRESIENYWWLVEHFRGLLDEYTFRYGKKHKCESLFFDLQNPPFNLKEFDRTPFVCAMPDEYKISDDPVINYRNYYNKGKKHLFKWSVREIPSWIVLDN